MLALCPDRQEAEYKCGTEREARQHEKSPANQCSSKNMPINAGASRAIRRVTSAKSFSRLRDHTVSVASARQFGLPTGCLWMGGVPCALIHLLLSPRFVRMHTVLIPDLC